MRFFERLRAALSRYQAGVHELSPPASPAAIAAVEARLGVALPAAYRDFLSQWNGGYLFHDDYAIHGAAGARPALDRIVRAPGTDGAIAIGRSPSASLLLDAGGRVIALDADDGTRRIEGSDFERWLDATMAREAVVYELDGEFRTAAFDGAELSPASSRKQAESALKADPDSPAWIEEQAQLLLAAGQDRRAATAFARAVALDPAAGGAWFALGKLRRADGEHATAAEDFGRAAAVEHEPAEAAFAWAHAARSARDAGVPDDAEAFADRARRALPSFVDEQRAAAEHLAAAGDLDQAIERLELALAVAADPGDLRAALGHARARRKLGAR